MRVIFTMTEIFYLSLESTVSGMVSRFREKHTATAGKSRRVKRHSNLSTASENIKTGSKELISWNLILGI
jgi:hypothetical protein